MAPLSHLPETAMVALGLGAALRPLLGPTRAAVLTGVLVGGGVGWVSGSLIAAIGIGLLAAVLARVDGARLSRPRAEPPLPAAATASRRDEGRLLPSAPAEHATAESDAPHAVRRA